MLGFVSGVAVKSEAFPLDANGIKYPIDLVKIKLVWLTLQESSRRLGAATQLRLSKRRTYRDIIVSLNAS